jgi:phage baseplate assembly protein W
MPAVRVPKLRFPFEIEGVGARVVEQDSVDEIAQCVYAVLATERDSRLEEPDYGITDPTFEENGMDLGEALLAINTWEPRAAVEAEQEILELVDNVRIEVSQA